MSSHHDDPPRCGTRLDVLSRWHDGDIVDPVLERHIESCLACRAALHDIGSTAIAVAGMSGFPRVPAAVNANTARLGRLEMADFVHELALACLALHAGAIEGLHLPQPPRPFADVAADIRSLHKRLQQVGTALDLGGLPTTAPRREQAPAAARACLAVLATLEGGSECQRTALSASGSGAPRAGSQS